MAKSDLKKSVKCIGCGVTEGQTHKQDCPEAMFCYVCDGPIHPHRHEYQSITGNLHRHKECSPGSPRWMKSGISEDSPVKDYFQTTYTTAKPPSKKSQQHILHKAIKAFSGRVRYLMFMHERDNKTAEKTGYVPLNWGMDDNQNNLIVRFNPRPQVGKKELLILVRGEEVDFEPRDTLQKRIEALI